MENSTSKSCKPCRAWWRLPLLLCLVLAAVVLSRVGGCRNGATTNHGVGEAAAPNQSAREHVSLAIDFGDGRHRGYGNIAWHEGMTVADLMRLVPGLESVQKGSGEMAFVTTIEGVANQGAGSNNWTYEVNGQMADKSFAVYKLRADDRVLWTFGPGR